MANFTNVQLIAQNNFRNVVRAVTVNKWIALTSAYLALKASLINQQIDTDAMVRATHGQMWGASIDSAKEEPIRKMIDTVKKMTQKDIKMRIALFNVCGRDGQTDPVAQLCKAPLEDKRIYLRAVQVVSTPVGAAYLGITAGVLNQFTTDHMNVIGGRYARGYCLSMDELFLIEQNPKWLVCAMSENDVSEVKATDDRVFDYLLYVGEDVACAFTNMDPSELRKATKAGAQAMRPFRLSDLEKIRVAKLNAQQQ